MVVGSRHQHHRAPSEEVVAATRLVLGLSAAVGGMAAGIGLINGQPMGWLAVPAAVLLLALALRARPVAGWAGAALWAGIVPLAHAEAMIGPLAMMVACIAVAVGPERLLSLVRRDVEGPHLDRPEEGTWIEES